MFVAIDPAAVLRFRIVEMERKQPIQSDNLIELIKRLVIVILRPQIVSRCEDVTGIETDTQPFRIFRFIYNLTQVLKAVSQIRSLPRRCL
ncbi:hypothetical protein GBAR_LOCUS23093 [Geodia barretti]|uniref:Uncharacterized protein n=1 Tax=Geodia barretti TaxID=519541 RepID=A0AA35T6A6_GEOBA|nr:hypothetical protein GBAR_LOCUS23093 [Geodia barretti]